MHATGSVSPRRARATACGGMWTARRTPTGKFSLGAPSGLWEQLMHNGEAQPRPMSATMDSTVSSVGTKKPLCFHKEVYEKAIVDDYREQAVLRSLNMQRVQTAHTQRVDHFRAQTAKSREFEQQIGNPAVWRRKRMAQVGARVASTRHQERPCFTDLDEFETRFAESRSNRPGTAESGVEARLAPALSPRDLLSAHARRIHMSPRQRGALVPGGHQHMPDVARLMLMTPRGEGMPLPGKDVLLVRLGVVPEPPRSPAKSIYDIHGRLVHSGNIVPGDDALDTDHEVRDPTNEMSDIREAGQLDEAPPIFLTAE